MNGAEKRDRKNKGGRPKKIRDPNEPEKTRRNKRKKISENEELKGDSKEGGKSDEQKNDDITPDDFDTKMKTSEENKDKEEIETPSV